MPTCYRHPTRETGVSCSSCGRPICPDCMTSTPVGMRCPECSRQRTRVHRMQTTPSAATVTTAIVAANVLIFVGQLASGGGVGSRGGGWLIEHGALYGPAVAYGHDYWQLVTSGFLHSGFLHVLFNMYFVWVIGNLLEPVLGSVRFAALYFSALLCGSFGVLLLQPEALTVGASGAAFGLLGAAIVYSRSRGVDISGLVLIAVLNFALTISIPGISIGGHAGGFVGGMLIGLLYDQADRRRLPREVSLGACIALGLVAAVAGIAVAGDAGLLGDSSTSIF